MPYEGKMRLLKLFKHVSRTYSLFKPEQLDFDKKKECFTELEVQWYFKDFCTGYEAAENQYNMFVIGKSVKEEKFEFSKSPRIHRDFQQAVAEKARLCVEHGSDFVIFRLVGFITIKDEKVVNITNGMTRSLVAFKDSLDPNTLTLESRINAFMLGYRSFQKTFGRYICIQKTKTIIADPKIRQSYSLVRELQEVTRLSGQNGNFGLFRMVK